VILIDTSAWVEFLHDAGSPACHGVDRLLAGEIATWHPVRMEVLAGARDLRHLQQLRRLLGRATIIPTLPSDFQDAAALHRLCRQRGQTFRRLFDGLIAAHAMRSRIPLPHADSGFDALPRCSELRVISG
jgi:predicted nucleic acid-binding protein